MSQVIDIVSLYPKDMNIYGDSGNVLAIQRRLALYGYEPRVHAYNQGCDWPEHVDMILGGGGQDTGQKKIIDDFFQRADLLRSLAADGVPMLMICGLYQLFGEYFETVDGSRLDGIGVIGAYTVGQETRMIGNLTETSADFGKIIGYENHSGQTFLRDGVQPLGTVEQDGTGNNDEDHTEGARVHNVIGTYMHGSLLPKNPAIADFLIRTAVERRYGTFDPAAAGQTDAQRAALHRIDEIADRARRVPCPVHADGCHAGSPAIAPPALNAGYPPLFMRLTGFARRRCEENAIEWYHHHLKEDIMADFNFGDGLRKVFLAGVGALATTVEKSQEIVDDLVKKGELTVEQGKALNAELKHKVEEAKEAPEAKDAAPAETEDKAE